MISFREFTLLFEAPAPPPPAGGPPGAGLGGPPGGMPGGPPGAGLGGPPMGGMGGGMPPMGGPPGGLGGPPMGGPPGGGGAAPVKKIKALDVWGIIEQILKSKELGKPSGQHHKNPLESGQPSKPSPNGISNGMAGQSNPSA